MEQRETKPPKYFDDASLLKAMTQPLSSLKIPNCVKRWKRRTKTPRAKTESIGTEATRSVTSRR
ncbi:hypothetical protein [Vibrio parahaemolyticus]|uniref:hypothetical protein n=1 Tax=Vibrio parahaemolyticus TaxID=670 RepID=UPI003857CFC5